MSFDLSPYLEFLSPYLERLEGLPYYPYSVIGAGVLLLLLFIMSLVRAARKKRRTESTERARPPVESSPRAPAFPRGRPMDGLSVSGEPLPKPPVVPVRPPEPVPPVRPPEPVPPVRPPEPVPPVRAEEPRVAAPVFSAPPAPPEPRVPFAPPSPPAPPRLEPEPRFPTAPTPAAPVPPSPVPMDAAIKASRTKAFREKFQEIYIEMYLELGLTSDFEDLRTRVDRHLETRSLGVGNSGPAPEALVLQEIAEVTTDMLKSGEHHIGRGLLSLHGQELFSVYRYVLRTMQAKGLGTGVEGALVAMETKIQELGI